MRNVIAAVAGVLFGLGLALSQMIDRARVLNFLDITALWSPDRAWDPTLAFVLGGAVAGTIIGVPLVMRRTSPLLDVQVYVPPRRDIDRPLVVGAALFGIGWGIAGYCPGPGISALTLGVWNPVLFTLSLVAGSLTYRAYADWSARRTQASTAGSSAPAPSS